MFISACGIIMVFFSRDIYRLVQEYGMVGAGVFLYPPFDMVQ